MSWGQTCPSTSFWTALVLRQDLPWRRTCPTLMFGGVRFFAFWLFGAIMLKRGAVHCNLKNGHLRQSLAGPKESPVPNIQKHSPALKFGEVRFIAFLVLAAIYYVKKRRRPFCHNLKNGCLKAYVSAKILNWHSLRHSHSAEICIHFYCLSWLRQARQRKMIQKSALWLCLRLCQFKISWDT